MRVLALGLLMACGAASTPAASSKPLVATLAVHDLDVDVAIENRGAAPVEMPTQVLGSAQLLLRVQDAKGADVPSGPPPTPTGEMTKIGAGERVTRKLRLDVFSPPLEPGEYSVTARGPDIESNTVRFRVGR